jgi:chromosome segregation ATPase
MSEKLKTNFCNRVPRNWEESAELWRDKYFAKRNEYAALTAECAALKAELDRIKELGDKYAGLADRYKAERDALIAGRDMWSNFAATLRNKIDILTAERDALTEALGVAREAMRKANHYFAMDGGHIILESALTEIERIK